MSSILINGIGNIPTNQAEYTSSEIIAQYMAAMQTLKQILESSTPASDTELTKFKSAVSALRQLALNGGTTEVAGMNVTYYMTNDMIVNLNLVVTSLSAVGISVGSLGSVTTNSLQKWQGLAAFGIDDIMSQAITISPTDIRTLQSMVELEFVKAGNQQIAAQMQALSQALQTSADVLNTLKIIQGISNQISVSPTEDFAFPPMNDYQISKNAIAALDAAFWGKDKVLSTGLPTFAATYAADVQLVKDYMAANPGVTYASAFSRYNGMASLITAIINKSKGKDDAPSITENLYRILASAHFTQLTPTPSPVSGAISSLLAAKNELLRQIQTMETLKIAYASSTNSLPNFMQKVASDISSYMAGVTLANANSQESKDKIAKWIMDNQNQKLSTQAGGTAGAIQDRITQAITAAQSLNDTQKANVQSAQYAFQQFYQSASNVLQSLNQILTTVARGIGG